MNKTGIQIYHEKNSHAEIETFLSEYWGSPKIVSRGKMHNAAKLPRFVARDISNKLVGLVVYRIDEQDNNCELVAIATKIRSEGIGSQLLKKVEKVALKKKCPRIWLITLNDNIEAAAFYIKKGYRLVAVHIDALEESRKLKPQLPKVGKHGITLMDEWEFEKELSNEVKNI